jgi:hypothetical protein
MGRGRFAISLMICGALLTVAPALQAQDKSVVRRLARHGKLSGGKAKGLTRELSKRMKRAADMTAADDPLRMAVSQALFGTPTPADQMAAAKVRLRLYAGLNDWALDNLFKPRPGAIAGCQKNFGASKGECESLVAASGRIALADARKLGGGQAVARRAPASGSRFGQRPSRFGQRPSRFGQRPSRFGGARPAQPSRFGAARPAQPSRFGNAAARRPAPARAAAPAARPKPSPASRKSAAERKAAYQARRQAYLERKKREMEERKAKLVAAAGGNRAERGPASEAEAEAAGVEMQKPAAQPSAPAAQPAAASAKADEPAAAAEPAPKKKEKAALDEGFLGDLLSDPLGGSN